MNKNQEKDTVNSFGDEWTRFDQSKLAEDEATKIFEEYFAVFPWDRLPPNASGFDMGCGSGRWARLVAPRVGHLHCIDPSSALNIARTALAGSSNVTFHHAYVDDRPLPVASQDFGYSLGVLHHVPDTTGALASCAALLKPGAPFLVYLYYAFDNRSIAYKLLWRLSDVVRRFVCRLPSMPKRWVTDVIAAIIYYPLARISLLVECTGLDVNSFPLSHYRHHSFYTMRTDSRDRFGTPLEQRFTRKNIDAMMRGVGFTNILFSDAKPYWCAVGFKQLPTPAIT